MIFLLENEIKSFYHLLETNQELEDLSQTNTKLGGKLTFKIYDISPDERNRDSSKGFIVHKIEAFINGKLAGYIKISYIPMKNFIEFSPPLKFAENWMNKLYKFNSQSLDEQVIQLARAVGADWNTWGMINKNTPVEELQMLKKRFLKELPEKIKKEKNRIKSYHVDKPIVDFINVEPEYRRQGIGEALYVIASKYLAKKGMKLYASGLQSNDAKASWENLKTKYPDKISSEPQKGNPYSKQKERITFSHLDKSS